MAEPTTGDLLFLLAKNGSEDIQELLNSSNYNAIDHLKNTLLHYAAAAKHENVVKLLLALDEEKKILNHQNNLGDTPLHKVDILILFTIFKIIKIKSILRQHIKIRSKLCDC